MNFPTDERYLEFVDKLKEMRDLRLTSGNCGIFAYALKEVFQTGTLFNIDNFKHVLLKHENKYYDGEHIYKSFEDLKNSVWGLYLPRSSKKLINNDKTYEKIRNNTCHTMDKEDFIKIIRNEFE